MERRLAAPLRGRYLGLHRSGELARRAQEACTLLAPCRLCPHRCGVDRFAEERGVCRTGWEVKVGAAVPHFGEEPVLARAQGVGNLFVSHCNLRCRYCQNFEISHHGHGRPAGTAALAAAMRALDAAGCRFIGWVSPSHAGPQLLSALAAAADRGFERPLIYNTSSWDSLEFLRHLDGVISVYLPDLKYASDEVARRLSGCRGYVGRARAAIEEMYRQVGDLTLDDEGLATGGLLVRHLVLPDDLAGSWETLSYLRIELGRNIGLSIMSQYAPTPRVLKNPRLGRPITCREYERVLEMVQQLGFRNVFAQELESRKLGVPAFRARVPFRWPGRRQETSRTGPA